MTEYPQRTVLWAICIAAATWNILCSPVADSWVDVHGVVHHVQIRRSVALFGQCRRTS